MAGGAVGGYFGGRLAAAGHQVAFIVRAAHRDAIDRDGLKIESTLGNLHLKHVNATNDPREVGPVDSCYSPSSCGIPRRQEKRRAPSSDPIPA